MPIHGRIVQKLISFQRSKNKILGLFGAFLFGACSTSVQITSNPSGAEVWVKPLGSGTKKNLGQTPMTFNPADLDGVPTSSGPLTIEMKKDGYKPVDLIITDIGSGKIEVHKDLEAGPGFDNPSKLNAHLERMFAAQQFIQMKRYDDAEKLLTTVREAVPTIAIVHELLGGIYFIKGEKVKALDAFQRALALNPTSVDAVNMANELSAQVPPSTNPEVSDPLLNEEVAQ